MHDFFMAVRSPFYIIGCIVDYGVNKKKCGTKSILFGKFKIMVIVNEIIFLCYFNIVIQSRLSLVQGDMLTGRIRQ